MFNQIGALITKYNLEYGSSPDLIFIGKNLVRDLLIEVFDHGDMRRNAKLFNCEVYIVDSFYDIAVYHHSDLEYAKRFTIYGESIKFCKNFRLPLYVSDGAKAPEFPIELKTMEISTKVIEAYVNNRTLTTVLGV